MCAELGNTTRSDEPSTCAPVGGCGGGENASGDVRIDNRGHVWKPWGLTWEIERKGGYRKVGCIGFSGYSSFHKHDSLANSFRVMAGCIDIEFTDHVERLEEGDGVMVPAGAWHRFIIVEPAIFHEQYFSEDLHPNWNDITRYDQGSGEQYQP